MSGTKSKKDGGYELPDWSYQPFFRPALFCLSGERARSVTMSLLGAQARIPGGPAFFRVLASANPPAKTQVRFGDLCFRSPVGLGSGIDVDGRAALLMQELGLGFLELGPLGARSRRTGPRTNPRRLRHSHALALSGNRGGPAIGDALPRLPKLEVPLGVRLRGEHLGEEVELASRNADFITLPTGAGGSRTDLREARAASRRLLLVRVCADWDRGRIQRVLANAGAAEIDGVMVAAATSYPRLRDGELIGEGALADALDVIARIGDRLPTCLAGGVLTPADAEAALAAKARLIFLSDGLVYVGPGLPKRINRSISLSAPPRSPAPTTVAADAGVTDLPSTAAAPLEPALAMAGAGSSRALGAELKPVPELISELVPLRAMVQAAAVPLFVAAAVAMIVSGLAYLVLAATAPLLAREAQYVGIEPAALCRIDDCRLTDFIAHGRACYGGALVAVGAMYAWLVLGPLRNGEVWAWWTLLFAGIAAQGSYFTFLAYGYVDAEAAVFIVVLVALWAAGLILVRPRIKDWKGPVSAFRTTETKAWMWSPAGRGRMLVFLFGLGLATGGTMILSIASTDLFVPQDLSFIGIDPSRLDAISQHLIPVMAHDRAGFGGGLLALGIMFLATAQKGLRPGARGAWRALGIAGGALVVFAFLAHVLVGYLDAIHLSPVYSGGVLLLIALVTLRRPLASGSYDEAEFPDV
jgi:dihydroorotate dehydrogenase